METRTIGSLTVSVVGLGCNNFGVRMDAKETDAVVGAALDAGITLFDTADIYGGAKSEGYLGAALGARRDQVVLATKFGYPYEGHEGGAAPAYVRRALEDTLRRLGTDHVDLYQLHVPDPKTPIADTLEALGALVAEGKVRELGCSNFTGAMLEEAAAAVAGGAPHFVSVQNQYSLLHREPEDDVLAFCERTQTAFLPFFPLASGLLSGKYRAGKRPPRGTRLATRHERRKVGFGRRKLATVDALDALAHGEGHTVLDLAFAWLLSHPPVASVIAGASNATQVAANVAAGRWKPGTAVLAKVDDIAPR